MLGETLDSINADFQKKFSVDAKDLIRNIEKLSLDELVLTKDEYLAPYLSYVKDNKHVFRAVLNNPISMRSDAALADMYKYILKPIFSRFGIPEEEQKYCLAYHIKGIMAIVFEWLKDDCVEPVNNIARIIQNCVHHGIIHHENGRIIITSGECEN